MQLITLDRDALEQMLNKLRDALETDYLDVEEVLAWIDAHAQPSPWRPITGEEMKRIFMAGWGAGFQEALKPDEFPDQDRGSFAYCEWLLEQINLPAPPSSSPEKEQ